MAEEPETRSSAKTRRFLIALAVLPGLAIAAYLFMLGVNYRNTRNEINQMLHYRIAAMQRAPGGDGVRIMSGEKGGFMYISPKDSGKTDKFRRDRVFTLPVGWILVYANNHYSLSLKLVGADSSKATFAYIEASSPAGSGRDDVSTGNIDFAYAGEVPKTDDSQEPAKGLREYR